MTPAGFPHSDIPGSTPAYGSPRRIVVRHVLHRLLAPRHPPCALCSLTFPPPQTGCKLHRCFLRFPRFAIRFSRCKLKALRLQNRNQAMRVREPSCFIFPRRERRRLRRKEVIQPHLPIRLPCYDFTPITSPTFDGCLPYGLAHRLRVLPAFVV